MGSGLWTLDVPTTPAQRLAARLVDIEARLDSFERTRPAVSVSTSDPTGTPPAGAMHLNRAENRLWFYGPSGWISGDSQHVYAEALSTVSAGNVGSFNYSQGPQITLTAGSSGFIAVFADVELLIAGVGSPVAAALNYSGGISQSFGFAKTNTTGVIRRETSAGGLVGALDATWGAFWSAGGWIVTPGVTPGVATTVQMGYQSTGTLGQVRNRRLYGIAL